MEQKPDNANRSTITQFSQPAV